MRATPFRDSEGILFTRGKSEGERSHSRTHDGNVPP
jgi:hypothetical protein